LSLRIAAAAAAVAAGAAVAIGVVLHRSSTSPRADAARVEAVAAEAGHLPAPETPAFRVGSPRLLSRHETRARSAPVIREAVARESPAATARPVASLTVKTTEGTTNIVLVIGERARGDGLWIHVRLPVLPNDLTGWVPRDVLGGYRFVHTHLVIDQRRLTTTLYRDRRPIFSAPIGVGRPDSPTPRGEFYVRDRLNGFGNPFYGPIAFGTSARSAVLTDWPGGGFVGIHGTNQPELIPGRISHGCVRLRNPDIVRLARLMPVGTPVTVR
jgi:lipoprotein-anchoring transpeptidase ErfK/SrfK